LLEGLIQAYGCEALAEKLESEQTLLRFGYQRFAVFQLATDRIRRDDLEAQFERHTTPKGAIAGADLALGVGVLGCGHGPKACCFLRSRSLALL
jgi:hypothetical protein